MRHIEYINQLKNEYPGGRTYTTDKKMDFDQSKMNAVESAKKPLYCHWDSHEQEVLFMNEDDLDQHIYSHFARFPESTSQYPSDVPLPSKPVQDAKAQFEEDSKSQQTVECHWDACHEMFDIDEIMEHFHSSHMDVSQHPHDSSCLRETKNCGAEAPVHTPYDSELNTVNMPAGNYSGSFQGPSQMSPISMMSPSSVSSHISRKSDYSTPEGTAFDNTASGVTTASGVPTASGVSVDENVGRNPSTNSFYSVPALESSTVNDNYAAHQSIGNNAEVYYNNQSEPHDPQQQTEIGNSYDKSDHPSSTRVKIDISSLPTLQPGGGSGCSDETLQFPQHTCMWLTEHGACNQHFFSSNELNAHIVHHHIDPQVSSCKWDGCKRENVPFNHRQKIIRHIQVHAKTTDHTCRICDRPMSSDTLLKTHELRHLNEWPYKCETCGRSFRTRNSLNVHNRTHTGVKPLVCNHPGCGKRFAESSNLAKHKRTHMAPQFKCPICSRMFTRKDHLRRHMQTKKHFTVTEEEGSLGQQPVTTSQPFTQLPQFAIPTAPSATQRI